MVPTHQIDTSIDSSLYVTEGILLCGPAPWKRCTNFIMAKLTPVKALMARMQGPKRPSA